MSALDKEKIPIPCPGCHKPINATVHDLYSTRRVRCSSCGSELEVTSSDASKIRNAINGIERATRKAEEAEKESQRAAKEFKEAVGEGIAGATLHVKKK